jgi:hypothetical protein
MARETPTFISVHQGRFDQVDIVGEHLIGDRKIVSEGVVIDTARECDPEKVIPRVGSRKEGHARGPCWHTACKPHMAPKPPANELGGPP